MGQEAIAVGVATALRADDYVLSTHRGHGHLVAKGGSLRGLMAELYGKANGICHGKGGTMHIADVSVGYLGANGVLAAGCVMAPGVALSIKHRRSGQVALTFFGDGAANRGPFHEGVNMAALWRLPVIFFCENNRWASTTAHALSAAGGSIAARAAGYGIPGESVDGNDVLAVHDAVSRAADARSAGRRALADRGAHGPLGRPLRGRSASLPRQGRGGGRTRARSRSRGSVGVLQTRGLLDGEHIERIRAGVTAEIDDAVAHAEASPLPEPADALTDLFALLALERLTWPWRDRRGGDGLRRRAQPRAARGDAA